MSEPELPEGWPDAFDEDARDYLYEEASTRLREVVEFGNQQLDKGLALLRLSLLVIAAGGIFGDLHLSPSLLDVLSATAIASALAVGALGLLLLYPREWETGANVEWLARWQGAGARAMKDSVLETTVAGFATNRRITELRGRILVLLVPAVTVQTVLVVSVQVVSALADPGA